MTLAQKTFRNVKVSYTGSQLPLKILSPIACIPDTPKSEEHKVQTGFLESFVSYPRRRKMLESVNLGAGLDSFSKLNLFDSSPRFSGNI